MFLNLILCLSFYVNCCETDLEVLKKISKSEKQFYSNHILPKSIGHQVDKKSYQSIIKRKTTIREQVLSKIATGKNFSLTSFGTFYLAEGADGAYSYGYIWNDSILIKFSYDPIKSNVSAEEVDREAFFNSPDGYFLKQVSKWDEELKAKPIWSNSSLMGGLCFFVSKVEITKADCNIETIGLYEFR